MKRITRFSFVLVAFALTVPSIFAGEKGLPPGLQKKDKLPPGWEKKQGRESENAAPATPAAPATTTNAAKATPATPATPAPTATNAAAKAPAPERSARAMRADIDQRVQVLNTLDNKTAARRAGVAAIVKETGTTTRVIENLRKEFPDLGTGGLLIATEIAAQTKKPAANFVRQRVDGKPWARIAAEHNVKLETIEAKLARVEDAMRNVK